MSAVNLFEVVSKLTDAGGPQKQIDCALGAFHLNVVPFVEKQAFVAGALRSGTRSLDLSNGDRSCLAPAKNLTATAQTTDRVWADLPETVGTKVEVIRR